MSTKYLTRCCILAMALMLTVALAPNAFAVQSPAGCNSNDFSLDIAKSISVAHIGDTVTYTVSAGNPNTSGNGCDVTNITIVGTRPDGSTVTLQSGGNYPIGTPIAPVGTFSYVVAAADIVGGFVTASANATGILNDIPGLDDPLTITKTVSVVVLQPNISVVKECTNASAPGQPINFSAVLTNTGNTLLSAITCTDNPDVSLTGVPASLAVGASATITGSYVPIASPSTDTITCSGTDVLGLTVTATDDATCTVTTIHTMTLDKECTATFVQADQNVLVSITATLTNTGNEEIVGITCSDTDVVALSGVPASLAVGASATITGTYTQQGPGALSASDTLTCSGTGAFSQAPVSATDTAACTATTSPAITVVKECTDATGADQPINFSAVVTNSGNETLVSIVCTDNPDVPLTGVPASLTPGASATVTGSYVPTTNPSTDTITCTGTGATSGNSVTGSDSATCTTLIVNEICRTPGFWGTHAGTEKKNSQNITQAVIDFAGGCIEICGEIITNTLVDDAESAVEAICVPVKGDIRLQLVRQLTAAALNCIMSGGGADCTGVSIEAVFQECNTTCVESQDVSEITECVERLDCFNNGGIVVENGELFCQTGTCANEAPCNEKTPCADQSECTPLENNCHDQPLCNEDIAELCFEPPGPAGSSNACNAANGTPCTVIPPGEEACDTGTISSDPELCPIIL